MLADQSEKVVSKIERFVSYYSLQVVCNHKKKKRKEGKTA